MTSSQLLSLSNVDVTVLQHPSTLQMDFVLATGITQTLTVPLIVPSSSLDVEKGCTTLVVPSKVTRANSNFYDEQGRRRRRRRAVRAVRKGSNMQPNPLLQEDQVREIKLLLADKEERSKHPSDYAYHKMLGEIWGVTGSNIRSIDKGNTWAHVVI